MGVESSAGGGADELFNMHEEVVMDELLVRGALGDAGLAVAITVNIGANCPTCQSDDIIRATISIIILKPCIQR